MTKNLGSLDRWFRVAVAASLLACAFFAPFSTALRVIGFGGAALYVLGTAVVGTCLGYRLMGRSSCPASAAPTR